MALVLPVMVVLLPAVVILLLLRRWCMAPELV